MIKPTTRPWVVPTITIASIIIFLLDLVLPIGSAEYIFYFIPVVLTVLHHRPKLPFMVAVLCTTLCFIGYHFSPPAEIATTFAFRNRYFAISAIWIVSFLVNRMIVTNNAVATTSWQKTRANLLVDSMNGELSLKELSNEIMNFFAESTEMTIGALYTKVEKAEAVEFLAGHAMPPSASTAHIPFGQGLVGQVAKDHKALVVQDLPPNYLSITSSTGSTSPVTVAVVPLIVDDELMGVIELGYRRNLERTIIDFFDQISGSIATAIRSAQYKTKLAELLTQAQQFSEELQAQQEELRVSNEELEQQSKALKDSHLKLENQQAELEQTNQQLEEQAHFLEAQKSLLDEKNQSLNEVKRTLEEKAAELEKSSQYKSEFLANMSHELRTPLNSTLILAKLLADNKHGNLNEEQVKYADVIYNSGNDLLNLINDILDLSKVEAGKMTIHPELVQVKSVLGSLTQSFEPIAQQKKLKLLIDVSPNVDTKLITDRQRLEQILKNLLSNAFKFTSEGSVTLRVEKGPSGISFTVADTGVGISPEQQSVIFEAFRQADGTTNRKYGGTGLGLSISRELSRILGGHITLSSTKGKGSEFTLHMPLKFEPKAAVLDKIDLTETPIVHVPQNRKPTPKVEESEQETLKFSFEDDRATLTPKTRTLLIIEDDERFAKILYDLAHEMKFSAIVAPTADEGLRMAREYRPQGIVLDVRLPDHSGLIVLDQLKMDGKTRHIPVHIISSEDFSKSALEMGAIGYMLKPVKREKIQDAFFALTKLMDEKIKHVLVVEDDEVQRDNIVRLISDKMVEVEAVDTSAKALEKLSSKTYDCMIMDLSLPDMSGHELLAKLSQEDAPFSFPPVIVYTARDLTAEEEEKLRLYSGSIIIKGAKSPERLLSEVTLFLHKVETEMPPERQKMLRDLRNREKNLENRNILVVDDDIRNVFALTSALEGYGAQISVARNGREALEKVTTGGELDLVLMDIMMPEMDGYEAITRIRANKKFDQLPIIALTAKAMSDDKEKCIAVGANDYLSKPINMEKLLSLIRVWLPSKRSFSR